MSSSRRFMPVVPPPYYAHWQYRGGSLEITVCRYLLGQHRVLVTWDGNAMIPDVLSPEF